MNSHVWAPMCAAKHATKCARAQRASMQPRHCAANDAQPATTRNTSCATVLASWGGSLSAAPRVRRNRLSHNEPPFAEARPCSTQPPRPQ
eukprot:11495069-Alexandrium_andersonii.AAC.1